LLVSAMIAGYSDSGFSQRNRDEKFLRPPSDRGQGNSPRRVAASFSNPFYGPGSGMDLSICTFSSSLGSR